MACVGEKRVRWRLCRYEWGMGRAGSEAGETDLYEAEI